MTSIERRATANWIGNLPGGSGTFSVGSNALGDTPVTWASRTERSNGKTSPEELIAAAQAACFSMALSNTLATGGHKSTEVRVTAVCGAELSTSGLKITTMDLYVSGTVPGLDSDGFENAARQAEQSCPVSNALRHSLSIQLHIGESPSASVESSVQGGSSSTAQ